jgi:hypothetical protein
MSRTDRALATIEDVARVFSAFALWVAIILTPIGPAYSIFRAARDVLGYPTLVATTIGVSVEAAGMALCHLAVRAWSWNRERPEGAGRAPAVLSASLVLGYLAAGITLAVLVGVYPTLIGWAPTVILLLGGLVYAAYALWGDQRRREAQTQQTVTEAEKTERARRAWLAALRERDLRATSAEARRALAEAGGDYLAALDLLPAGPSLASTDSGTADRIGDFDALLSIVSEQSGGGSFGPADVQRWLSVGRTRSYELVSYGRRVGDVRRVGRGEYRFNHFEKGGGDGV